MTVVLDAGALLAIERRDQSFIAYLRAAQRRKIAIRTSAAVVAQVWRDGRRQAELARQLPAIDQRPLSPQTALTAGRLLGAAARADVVDAHIALLCSSGDAVFTSDMDDLQHLLAVRGIEAAVERV